MRRLHNVLPTYPEYSLKKELCTPQFIYDKLKEYDLSLLTMNKKPLMSFNLTKRKQDRAAIISFSEDFPAITRFMANMGIANKQEVFLQDLIKIWKALDNNVRIKWKSVKPPSQKILGMVTETGKHIDWQSIVDVLEETRDIVVINKGSITGNVSTCIKIRNSTIPTLPLLSIVESIKPSCQDAKSKMVELYLERIQEVEEDNDKQE